MRKILPIALPSILAILVLLSTQAAPFAPVPTLTTTPTRAGIFLPLVRNPPTLTPTSTATNTPVPTNTPTSTPVPPPLSSIVIQPSDVSSSYTIDEFREVGNDESAGNYLNPTEARQRFVEQGRESSWFVRYISAFSVPLGISDQGIRYLTVAGADAGLDYAIADIEAKHPDYQQYPAFIVFGDRSVAIRWGFIQNGHAYYQNYYAIRKGRYVALVQVLYYQGDSPDVHSYARKATNRLPNQ